MDAGAAPITLIQNWTPEAKKHLRAADRAA
jgi:hypothetical protein